MQYYCITEQKASSIRVHSNTQSGTALYYCTESPHLFHIKEYDDYDFTIDNLYAGEWVLYDSDSIPNTFQFNGQSNSDIFEYIAKTVEVDEEVQKEIESAIKTYPELSLPEAIYQAMPKTYDDSMTEDTEIYKNWLQVLRASVYYYNYINRSSNIDYEDIKIVDKFYTSEIASGLSNGYVVIYNTDGDYITTIYGDPETGAVTIDALDPGVLYIAAVHTYQYMIQFNYVYQGKPEDYTAFFYDEDLELYKQSLNLEEELTQTIGLNNIPEEMQSVYLLETKYNPTNVFLPAPIISYNPTISQIEVSITNYDLVSTFNQELYVVASEEDQLTASGICKRSIPITGKTLKLYRPDYMFNNEPYYWYIENQNGDKISPISYYDLTLDENEYPEQERMQRCVDMINRMAKQLQYDLDINEARSVLLDLDEASQDTDITTYELMHQGIQNYISDFRNRDTLNVIYSLYMDKIYHENVDFSLLDTVYIRKNWHLLEFPASNSEYIIEVFGYNTASNSEYDRMYYHSSDKTSTSIRYDTYDYMVFTAFSETGWRICGFLAFNNTESNRLIYKQYQFPTEVTSD